jgi:hypothetical protein
LLFRHRRYGGGGAGRGEAGRGEGCVWVRGKEAKKMKNE